MIRKKETQRHETLPPVYFEDRDVHHTHSSVRPNFGSLTAHPCAEIKTGLSTGKRNSVYRCSRPNEGVKTPSAHAELENETERYISDKGKKLIINHIEKYT